jgi:hypothetical protein
MTTNTNTEATTTINIDATLEAHTYEIPVDNMEKFMSAFRKLSKQAEKFLGKPFDIEFGEKKVATFEGVNGKKSAIVQEITIKNASIPVIAGWQFAASIIHQRTEDGKIINCVKSMLPEEIAFPKEFRTEKPKCDHCQVSMYRAHSFIVYNATTGEFKQVGKQCLRKYTNNKDILSIARIMEYLHEMRDDYDFMGSGFSGGGDFWRLDYFLQVSIAVIRAFGYVSARKARESMGELEATKGLVLRYMWINHNPRTESDITFYEKIGKFMYPEDLEKINQVIQAFQFDEIDTDNLNDYQFNCYGVVKTNHVIPQTAGIAASMVASLEKQNRVKSVAEIKKQSSYIGNVKDCLRCDVEVLQSNVSENQWGQTYYIYMLVKNASIFNKKGKKETTTPIQTNENDVICWKASGSSYGVETLLKALESKEIVKITGTVKEHSNWNGTGNITNLTRCCAVTLEDFNQATSSK